MLACTEGNKFTDCIDCNRISVGTGHDTISEISLKKFCVQQRESTTLSSNSRQRGVQVKKTGKKLFFFFAGC